MFQSSNCVFCLFFIVGILCSIIENVKNCSVIIELVGECFYKFKYIKVCCYIVFSVIDGKKYCVYVKFKGQGKSSLLLEGWMFLGCVDFIFMGD